MLSASPHERLAFELSVLDSAGEVAFTGHYDVGFAADPQGTRLLVGLRITETTVDAVDFIAGIETGWNQVLDKLADAVGETNRKGQSS